MWRRRAETRGGRGKKRLVLSMPKDVPDSFPPELVELGHWLWEMSDYRYIPHPQELLMLPTGWVEALTTFDTGVRFFEDLPKRPKFMK